jgi:predicted secreted protein
MKKLKYKNLLIGVLSCITNDNYLDYYSKEEIKCFDFYYKKFRNTQVYITPTEKKNETNFLIVM